MLGTDVRSGAFAGPDEAETENCIEAVTSGRPTDNNCKHGPYRSDTIMLIRAGAGTFRKLSIPRDTLAEVPGQGPQKINSAYASGGAKLAVRTVEGMLGIDVDQVAIIDFDGFRSFIDTIGGITVDLPNDVCSTVSGGAFNLESRRRARTISTASRRSPWRAPARTPAAPGEFAGTDVERAQFQQLILDGIKGKLTSITSLPMNFIKGPLIGWNAPKAMVSEHGRADHAPAGDRGGERRRRRDRRAQAVEHDRRPATWSSRPRSASAPPRSCSARNRRAARTARSRRARRLGQSEEELLELDLSPELDDFEDESELPDDDESEPDFESDLVSELAPSFFPLLFVAPFFA